MSKLDELIKELCPNGIDYCKLVELAEIGTGNSNRKDAVENGTYPFYVRSKDVFSINTYEYDEEAIIIPGEGSVGDVFHYVNGKYALHQRAYRIHIIDDRLDTKFLYHYMRSAFKSFITKKAVNATVTSIRKPMLEGFEVPLPDLLIQREIVHILDSFTLLTAELTAELTARKQQYDFYRDYLLNFEDDSYSLADYVENLDFSKSAKSYRLDELCGVYDGTHQTPDYKTSGVKFVSVENINDLYGTTKYISESDFDKYKIKPQKNDVLMTRIGDIGTPAIVTTDEPLAYYVSLALLRPNTDIILAEYLYHFISTRYFRKELNKRIIHTAVPIKINKNDIGKCMITVPSIETQRKLIDILNRFDKLANDMSEGLPAEIEARKQQYEYYRDVLLSFDENRRSELVAVERERERERERETEASTQ